MILGTLQYPSRYGGLGEKVERTLHFLASADFAGMRTGRYPIEGDSVFMDLMETTTVLHDSRLFEAHRKYVDIHLTLEGEEWYGYAPLNNLALEKDYDKETDIAWYGGEGVYFLVPRGQFILFFPEDAHKPCITFKEPGTIRKVVVKIESGIAM